MAEHTPEAPAFTVGDRVRALVDMENDLTDEGMGVELCAKRGEELIVRKVSFGFLNCISVSHEHITDRAFCAAPNELTLVSKETTQ